MFARTKKPSDPVTIQLDGKAIEAQRGEPLAVSLLAASVLRLARSPKLHRPRGPSCLRGDCDGCLARVNDVPNVLSCMRRAEGGERIVSQNVLGSRETDLLRITDWFFPKGIDHHHLMAGIPGVTDIMQSFARKLAGIGRLPTEALAVKPAKRVACDVLVVGAGIAGTVVASHLALAGVDLRLVEEGHELGGSGAFAGNDASRILQNHAIDMASVHLESTVVGVFDGEAVIATNEGAVVTRPRAVVLATGAHDGVLAVPNNDLPGVMSARALAKLARAGVMPTEPLAVCGEGFWLERTKALFGSLVVASLRTEELAEIEGTSRVKGVLTRDGRRIDVRLVAVATPPAPSFELAEMMGARIEHRPEGYRVACDDDGRAGPALWATGECTGATFVPEALERRAQACAVSIARELRSRESSR